MAITDPLVLSRDVILVPVAELPEETRARFSHDEGDFAITHPRSRTPSRILDASSASLVEQFREPRTIVEAVIRFCRERGTEPEVTLEEAYPLLQKLLTAGFLVEEGAADAEGIKPSLHPGEEVAGFTVVECVQGLEDTELYLVRAREGGHGALKIERPAVAGRPGGLFEREEAILRWLDGAGCPRLLASGALDDGRRWLVSEWLSGVDAATAAWEMRRDGGGGRRELLALARRLAEAYAALHARGVVHADVHLRNALVGADSGVRLLDFGYSRWDAAPAGLEAPGRAGVAFFYEPEYAAALRAGQHPPDASPAGEQYAVAALLYHLLTGAHPRDYSLDKDEMLRQIAQDPPLPFAERGVEPWPAMEEVLRRALVKDPAGRYPSMADFAAALAAVNAETVLPRSSRSRPNDLADAEALLERVRERVRPGGVLWEEGVRTRPTASVNYGAAGIACALYRMAQGRADGELLALADLWVERAAALAGTEGAWHNPEIQIDAETIGHASLYHTAPGLHATRALIAHAQSFPALHGEAVAAWLAAVREPGPNRDLTLGRSGLLLGGALLLDTLEEGEARRELIAWGEELRQALWGELDAEPEIRDEDPSVNLGLAHGWAGHLYAALRWSRSAGSALPGRLEERLSTLADCARPWGRGVRWRWHGMEGGLTMPGWCNGSAGHLFLWTLAAETFEEPRWRDLAERTAWNTWESNDTVASLCCGLAGRSYALLSFWRKGGGGEWLTRARALANRAARSASHPDAEKPDSLYKGAMGVAALTADLARPEGAAMPLFEEEGW